jgi:hypothetical protein
MTKESVSRWENGRVPISPIADRFLRLAVAHEAPIADYHAGNLEAVQDSDDGAPAAFVVRRSHDEWSPAA